MKLENIHIAYFIGVGGIGMSALARWFNKNKVTVAGYDKTPTTLTNRLIDEGIDIHFKDSVDAIPVEFFANKENAIVIYTPAVPDNHKELNYLIDNGFEVVKRSEMLGVITKDMFTVAVAGTHGKTTTSSMIAHILKDSGANCAAFLGGITVNYKSNLLMSDDGSADSIVVVEADEYDRSFLTLFPDIAVITSADPDHLDIYDSKDKMHDSFRAFIDKLSDNGILFIQESIVKDLLPTKPNRFKAFDYSMNKGVYFAENIRIVDAAYIFDFVGGTEKINDLELKVPGFHNLENAIAAIAVALKLGITVEKIRKALTSYAGVNRRFEYILKRKEVVYIDDYAHHPVEIESFLKSVRALYPGKKITAVFQPHLYSRTRDFADWFAKSLSLADAVFMLDIYPAREQPIAGVTSEIIYKNVEVDFKERCTKENIAEKIKDADVEVLVTIGAGDIDVVVEPLKNVLKGKYSV